MSGPDIHLGKAREAIEFACYALAGGYSDEAGPGAFTAAHHAARQIGSGGQGCNALSYARLDPRNDFSRHLTQRYRERTLDC